MIKVMFSKRSTFLVHTLKSKIKNRLLNNFHIIKVIAFV